jgi:hypothetical protein
VNTLLDGTDVEVNINLLEFSTEYDYRIHVNVSRHGALSAILTTAVQQYNGSSPLAASCAVCSVRLQVQHNN